MRNISVSVRDKVACYSSRAADISAIFDTVTDFSASDRLSRDQVNDRPFTDKPDRGQGLIDEMSFLAARSSS